MQSVDILIKYLPIDIILQSSSRHSYKNEIISICICSLVSMLVKAKNVRIGYPDCCAILFPNPAQFTFSMGRIEELL